MYERRLRITYRIRKVLMIILKTWRGNNIGHMKNSKYTSVSI